MKKRFKLLVLLTMGVLIALKSTIRDQINMLFDANTFNELGQQVQPLVACSAGEREEIYEGVITGYGTIGSQLVFMYWQDGASPMGSFSQRQSEKLCQLLQLACNSKAPVVGIIDSKGARISEGLDILKSYSKVYQAHLTARQQVPLIIGVLGNAVGADALIPSMADFVFALRGKTNWHLSPITSFVETGEQVDGQTIGSGDIHWQTTGQAHFLYEGEEQLFAALASLIQLLPGKGSNQQLAVDQVAVQIEQAMARGAALEELIGHSSDQEYNVIEYLKLIWGDSFLELHSAWGQGMVTGLASIMGITVGVMANQPAVNQGKMDVYGLRKAIRLISTCEQYNLPLISFVNSKSFLAESTQEYLGISQEVSNLYSQYTIARVPKITFVIGSAMGTCFNLMGSKGSADLVYAWPTAQIGLLNPEATNYILNYSQLQQAEEPGAMWQKTLEKTKEQVGTPKAALAAGLIDGLVQPGDTYLAIYNSLNMLQHKDKGIRGNCLEGWR